MRRGEILKGEAGIGRKRKDLSFEKAKEIFTVWVEAEKKPKTVAMYKLCLRQLERSFGGQRLGQITEFAIEKHKHARIKEGAKVSANRELATLRRLFNWTIEKKRYEGDNPVKGVKMGKETARDRCLTPDEESRLLANAKEPLRTIILTGLDAGLRITAEALTLRKEDIDLRRGLLTVRQAYSKNNEVGYIPINARLMAALEAQMERSQTEHVFVQGDGKTPYKSIRTAFETACRNAKLKDVTPHVLRHTFASRLAEMGIDLRTIQELGRWKTLQMVERYGHISDRHKREAVERLCRENLPAIHFPTPFTTPSQDSVESLQQAVGK